MEKNRIWIRDRITIKDFYVGQSVMLGRRKQNGYPKKIKSDILYKIISIQLDVITIGEINSRVSVHYSYLLPSNVIRDEAIKEILKD
jgi:hypothetical protein